MINFIKATNSDLEMVMSSRIEMLKVVNGLSEDAEFDRKFIWRQQKTIC